MGFKILENNKDKINDMLDGAIEEALRLMGMQAENYARANAPTDTGLLKNSITSAVGGGNTTISHYHADRAGKSGTGGLGFYSGSAPKENIPYVVIGSNVEYAPYQELGTSKAGACNNGRGFLRPAINDHVNEYKKIFEDTLRNG